MGRINDNGLTDQRIRFCHEYLANQFNGAQAALKAGYAKGSEYAMASVLLAIPKVKEYIAKLIKEKLSQVDQMTLEWMQDVTAIQRADITNIVNWENGKVKIKNSDELSPDESYAISEISEHMVGGERVVRVKLESKTKALELKGRALNLFMEASIPKKKKEELTKDEKLERLAFLLNKRKDDG